MGSLVEQSQSDVDDEIVACFAWVTNLRVNVERQDECAIYTYKAHSSFGEMFRSLTLQGICERMKNGMGKGNTCN
jgi:hypothetical protein